MPLSLNPDLFDIRVTGSGFEALWGELVAGAAAGVKDRVAGVELLPSSALAIAYIRLAADRSASKRASRRRLAAERSSRRAGG
jgi:hypothetical protein